MITRIATNPKPQVVHRARTATMGVITTHSIAEVRRMIQKQESAGDVMIDGGISKSMGLIVPKGTKHVDGTPIEWVSLFPLDVEESGLDAPTAIWMDGILVVVLPRDIQEAERAYTALLARVKANPGEKLEGVPLYMDDYPAWQIETVPESIQQTR